MLLKYKKEPKPKKCLLNPLKMTGSAAQPAPRDTIQSFLQLLQDSPDGSSARAPANQSGSRYSANTQDLPFLPASFNSEYLMMIITS